HMLAIFDKPDPLDGPLFEETIYVTPSTAPDGDQQAIADAIGRAACAIGLRHGPVHAECRVNAEGVFVLEVAARPIGGLRARSPRLRHQAQGASRQSAVAGVLSTVGFEEVLLRHALGEPVCAA